MTEREEELALAEAARFAAGDAARASVLVVDDDRRNLFAVAEVLRDLDHDVVLARSGDEALACLLRRDFAVILLDVHMSGLSGYDTAALIRSRERSRATPIIFITAVHQDDAHVFVGYEAGAVDYLFKPINPAILRAKVAVFAELDRRRAEIELRAALERSVTFQQLARERALRRREEEQSVILKSLSLALYRAPMMASATAPRFVRGNVEQITGFPAERFLNEGEFWTSRLHPDDRDRVLAELAAIEPGRRATLEYRWLHADDSYRSFLDQAVFLPESGGTGQIVGTWLDVTERKSLESQLHHSQKLEALGRLTGGVAHDLNNLLTAIKGNLEMLRRPAGEPDRMPRLIDAALRAADRGEILGRQLLAFARRQLLHPELLDLAGFVRGMSDLLQGLLGPTIRLDLELPEELWPVTIDAGQLELAILNVAANARDAMAEGGTFRIAGRNVPADGVGGHVELVFEDSGTGIAPHALDRVFEPFFTTKEREKGTGLGLSQVYGFVRQSGGDARIESTMGVGTAVTLLFPSSGA